MKRMRVVVVEDCLWRSDGCQDEWVLLSGEALGGGPNLCAWIAEQTPDRNGQVPDTLETPRGTLDHVADAAVRVVRARFEALTGEQYPRNLPTLLYSFDAAVGWRQGSLPPVFAVRDALDSEHFRFVEDSALDGTAPVIFPVPAYGAFLGQLERAGLIRYSTFEVRL